MLIEYYATDQEDQHIERVLENFTILNWFNPEDGYYVLETEDERVLTLLSLLNIELYVSGTKISGAAAHL